MRVIRTPVGERADLLDGSPLFAELPAEEKRALAAVMSLRSFDPEERLFLQGRQADGFYVVTKGKVKAYRVSHDGREQVLHMLVAGEVCGEVPVFQTGRVADPTYPASAAAVGPVRALYVPRGRFLELAMKRPEMLLEMLAILSVRLRRFVGLIDDLSLKEVSARVAKHLVDLSVREGAGTVTLDTTKAVLASRLGTIAETLSRTLKKMQTRGIIAVQGRTIRILEMEQLTALAAGMKL